MTQEKYERKRLYTKNLFFSSFYAGGKKKGKSNVFFPLDTSSTHSVLLKYLKTKSLVSS